VAGGIGPVITSALQDLARCVVYWVAAILLVLRRGTILVGLGLALPVLALAVALWLGFDYSPTTAFFMLTLLSITVVTQHQLMDTPRTIVVIAVAAVAQVIGANLWVPASPGFTVWQHLMFH
jgi:hypothetical protein